MTKTIEIVISPDGQTKVEAKGFAGEFCREASHFIKNALDTRVREELTAEFQEAQAKGKTTQQQS